jgi:hypothetical protein
VKENKDRGQESSKKQQKKKKKKNSKLQAAREGERETN